MRINMHLRFGVALVVAMGLCASAFAQSMVVNGTIIKKDGREMFGQISWRQTSKEYVLTNPKTKNSVRISPKDVARVKVATPRGLDAAILMVRKGQYAQAIPELEKIRKAYTMLEWDVEAARWLASCYMGIKNPSKAVDMCEQVMRVNPQAVMSGDLARVYWEALKETGQHDKLKTILGRSAEEGSREVAAVAQIMRGDIDEANGKLREALVDGYLRTIVMFQQVKEVQPEALFKAIKCHEKLGEHSHAEKWRKKLLSQYPESSYAQQLKSM